MALQEGCSDSACPKQHDWPAVSAFACSSQQSDDTAVSCGDASHLQRCSSATSVSSRQQPGPSPSRTSSVCCPKKKRGLHDGIATATGSDPKRQKGSEAAQNNSAWRPALTATPDRTQQQFNQVPAARAGQERLNNRESTARLLAPDASLLTSNEQLQSDEEEACQTPLPARVSAALDAGGAPVSTDELTEMLSHLYEAEARSRPSVTFLEDQHGPEIQPLHHLDPAMRTTAVSWLIEVAQEYGLHQESVFLATALLDRYLSATRGVARTELQLTSVACMLVAAKHEEERTPSVADFAHIADDSFKVSDLLFMERQLLDVLNFRINTPTQYTFWSVFRHICPLPHPVAALASYLIELTLLDYEFLHYSPSEIASAAILLALGHQEARAHEQGLSMPAALGFQSLAVKSGYRTAELLSCAQDLCLLHARAAAVTDAASPFMAIKEKYVGSAWHYASQVPPRVWLPEHICAPAAFL